MNMPTRARRFVANAAANPQAYAAYVRQNLGHEPQMAEALLNLHAHLHYGGRVEAKHVKLLQHAYPNVAQQIPAIVDRLNEQPPGMRPRYFLGLLSGDTAVLQDRLHEAGDDFRALDRLSTTYHTEAIADELNRRRGGSADASPEWHPERGSVRELIHRQFEPLGAREAAEALERGDDPDVMRGARLVMADKMEAAVERLKPDADVLTRDSVAAAYDYQATDDVAVDLGFLPEREES